MIAVNGLLLLATQEQSVVPINQSAVSYYTNAAIEVPVSPSKRPLLYHTWSEHCL
jgi:hypothetical protein